MKNTIYLLAFLLFPASASAQSLTTPTVLYSAAVSADYTTTLIGLHSGARETNPVYHWAHNQPAAVLAMSVALDTSSVLMIHHLLAPKHRRLAATLLYVGTAFRVSVAAYNLTILHQQRAVSLSLTLHP